MNSSLVMFHRTHSGHFLERIAGEFNQLQFHVNQSKGHPIIESIKPVSMNGLQFSLFLSRETFWRG